MHISLHVSLYRTYRHTNTTSSNLEVQLWTSQVESKKNERKKNEYKDPLLAVSFALLLLLMMNNRHDITWISINRTQMLEWEIPLCLPSHLYFPYPHSRRRCFLTPKNGLLEIEAINNTTNKGNYWLPPAWTARCHAVKHPWMPYTEGNGQSMSSIFPNGDTAAAFWW